MVKADASQTQRCLGLMARLSDKYNRALAIQDSASPERILPVQTNVEAACQMSCRVHRWLTRIDHLCISVHQAHNLIKSEWCQGRLHGLGQSRPLPAIEVGSVRKIRRNLRLIRRHEG